MQFRDNHPDDLVPLSFYMRRKEHQEIENHWRKHGYRSRSSFIRKGTETQMELDNHKK